MSATFKTTSGIMYVWGWSGTISGGTTLAADGTVAAPSYSFTNSTGAGLYRVGSNNVGAAANGALIFDWNASRVLFAQPIYAADGTGIAPGQAFGSEPGLGLVRVGVNQLGVAGAAAVRYLFDAGTGNFTFPSNGVLAWTSGVVTATPDLLVLRDAANTLAQRNGTNAQMFRVYNTYATAGVDYERGVFGYAANVLRIGTEKGGTGINRAVDILSGGALTFKIGGSETSTWQITSSGHLVGTTDNTYDIGASTATRPRTGYFGTSVVSANGSAATPAFLTRDSGIFSPFAGYLGFSCGTGNCGEIASDGWHIPTALSLSWAASGAAPTLVFERDANDVFAQRRGTNAQSFRMYETFTDASNYSRLALQATGTTFDIYGQQAGTGVARALRLGANNAPTWQISTAGHFLAVTDNTNDIGASAATRPRTVYVGTSIVSPTVTAATLIDGGQIQAGVGSVINWNGKTRLYGGATDGVLALYNAAQSDFTSLQFGGTTSSFPSIKRNGTDVEIKLADDSAYTGINAAAVKARGGFFNTSSNTLMVSPSAPTVSSGFGSSPSIPNSNGTAAFTINVGTGGTATGGVLTMPAAATGWVVDCVNITNAATSVTIQTAGTTTSVTLANYSRTTGLLTAWTASDIIRCKAIAY